MPDSAANSRDITGGVFSRPDGVLSVKQIDKSGKARFLPETFITKDKSGSVSFVDNSPRISVRTKTGELILTDRGYHEGSGDSLKKLNRYTRASVSKIASAVLSDATMQRSLLQLTNGLHSVVLEYIAASKQAPDPTMKKRFADSSASRRNYTRRPAGLQCQVVKTSVQIEKEIWGWVEHVTTAVSQAKACAERCTAKPLWEVPACLFGCAIKTFVDLLTTTWSLLETVTVTVVTYVTHCILPAATVPSFNGAVVVAGPATIVPKNEAAAKAEPTLKPFEKLLQCFIGGQWTVGNLGDIGLSIPGVEAIPVTISVCMGKACADEVLDQFGTLGFAQLVTSLPSLIAGGAAEAWLLQNAVLAPLLTQVAAVIGVPVAAVAGVILTAILVLAVQALVIAGQIWLLDQFNAAPNGVCLHYPVFPIAAVGVINPVAALVIAANTPVVVTGR
jgi:hypothetical protein